MIEQMLAWIVETAGRSGVKVGKGFYDYDAKGAHAALARFRLCGKWRTDASIEDFSSAS
jgi:hypothetical protein